jgi:twinkle protein
VVAPRGNKKAERDGKGEPTCIVACEKQRNGEYEGKFGFWFDIESQQYLEAAGSVASRYGLGNG